MKTPYFLSVAAIALFATPSCDKNSTDVSKKIAELEQKNNEATERQRQLEQEIEDQKLASEREAIERERAKIEDDREDLERQQGEAAAEKEEAIRQREEALARREGKLEQFQAALEEKQDDLEEKSVKLSDRDRDLAGREALPFQQTEQREPVGDYGTFYDSLSSYGSWFETAEYGYVWQPVVVRDSNWRPYSKGRWVCSDRGWNWVSEEPFGWATYHYGRWALLRGRGWIWVPGSEWAPCWVSWRENDSHIGWAPLPPETLAYRGHSWDSTVDVQFGIGALWFNFVEIRNFGNPVYNHCLPVSGNAVIIGGTTNITYIHIENRQIICGGPRYRNLCDRIGRQLPFYRLEIDQHPRVGRDPSAMRPRIKGDRLMVSAPNIDVAWNDGLKPGKIKGRMESIAVEREQGLSRDISDRYRQSREDGRRNAEETIGKPGGAEKSDRRRNEQVQDSRQADPGGNKEDNNRDLVKNPGRARREDPANLQPGKMGHPDIPDQRQDRVADDNLPAGDDPQPEVHDDRRKPVENDRPRVTPPAEANPRPDPRPQRQVENPPVPQKDDNTARQENDRRREQQEETRREQQRQTEQARDARQETMRRGQEEQARQKQQEKQREAEQAREEQRQQAMEQERAQRQQQEENQRRQQERAERQQQEQQEMQRQQEQTRQRQQQQEENQRQQEQARQRQQEENQRQRQQEESRQKQQKDQDEQRKRNR